MFICRRYLLPVKEGTWFRDPVTVVSVYHCLVVVRNETVSEEEVREGRDRRHKKGMRL